MCPGLVNWGKSLFLAGSWCFISYCIVFPPQSFVQKIDQYYRQLTDICRPYSKCFYCACAIGTKQCHSHRFCYVMISRSDTRRHRCSTTTDHVLACHIPLARLVCGNGGTCVRVNLRLSCQWHRVHIKPYLRPSVQCIVLTLPWHCSRPHFSLL